MTARRAFASLALLTLILVGLTIAVRALPRPTPQPVSPLEVDATPTMTAGISGDRGTPDATWWRVGTNGGVALVASAF
jgi:hypothetical protein